jgi:hypothetical protein
MTSYKKLILEVIAADYSEHIFFSEEMLLSVASSLQDRYDTHADEYDPDKKSLAKWKKLLAKVKKALPKKKRCKSCKREL